METPLARLPPDHRLLRKEVQFLLHWSRTTLWRRERDGLRFVAGTIEVRELAEWIERWERRTTAEPAMACAVAPAEARGFLEPLQILLDPPPGPGMFALPKNGHR